MKLTRYSVSVEDFPNSNSVLLFSTFNGKLVVLPKKIAKEITEGCSEEQFAEFSDSSSGGLRDFVKSNFCVDDDADEEQMLVKRLNSMKFSMKTLLITLGVCMDCNFHCVYCYEKGAFSKAYMNREVASQVIRWISRILQQERPNTLIVELFGGEPLLNVPVVEYFLKEMQKSISKQGSSVRFEVWCNTNGVLLSRKNVDRLKALGLRSVQISIDGPPRIHNLRRRWGDHEKGDSFDTIMVNIKNACDLVEVLLRINVDYQNLLHIPELFDIIVEENLRDKVCTKLEPVDPIVNSAHCQKYAFRNSKDLSNFCWLWEEQAKRGFRMFKLMPTTTTYENIPRNSYVIDPVGNICLFQSFIGRKEFVVGNVLTGLNKEFYDSLEIRPWMNCLQCNYVPICQGGSRDRVYGLTGRIDGIDCKKQFYDHAFPRFLKHLYFSRNFKRMPIIRE
jgi:uncharacterized protein